MRFVADENFPREALRLLRRSGFDVASIAETSPGLPDTEVLGIASTDLAIATLQSGVAWGGHFCVVKDRKIRIRPLPPRSGSD